MFFDDIEPILLIGLTATTIISTLHNRRLSKQNKEYSNLIQELENSKEQFLSIIEADTDWHWEVDTQGRYTYLSARVKDTLGYEVDELLGKTPFELMPPSEAEKILGEFGAIVSQGKPFRNLLNLNIHRNGQEVMLETSGNPIHDSDGNVVGYRGIDRNVTQRFKVQQNLEAAKLEAENANKAKSEFLANMSHEIRTPLNAVLGFAELLERTQVTTKQQTYLESIKTGGKTLLSLINDILDLSKIEAGKLQIHIEPSSIKDLMNDIQLMFTESAKNKNLDFIFKIDSTVPSYLYLDETRIRQVLFNLIGNAIKFTHTGSVSISIYGTYIDNADSMDIFFEINDTGIGIPKEQTEKIFGSFEQQNGQNNNLYGGTGLGLAISKKLLLKMGGNVTLKSEVGKGSSFLVSLKNVKIADSISFTPTNNILHEHNLTFKTSTILLADDVESNRNLIINSLSNSNSGLKFIEATNGLEAVFMCETYKPDLIIMDIRMPIMNGIEAAQKLKANKEYANIPIIVLTASMEYQTQNKINNPFDGFLHKPIIYNNLITEVERFIPTISSNKIENQISNDLLENIKNDVIPLLDEAKNSGEFDKYQELSALILTIAQHHDITNLIHYAYELKKATDSFDIGAIEHSLNNFNNIYKNLLENSNDDR